ncbi:MAG: 4Fe-4S binding protein [Spirochaetales bacterium]|uniref:4Fe-4S binding protein n=1 Tax=Candidatus Thalassospirochaeta sargassi TaxID=3119039 RepID=A0AAJ1MKE1_9SPIO|nr:4Fe-4S binding protein [Spirochaetales bacterium]
MKKKKTRIRLFIQILFLVLIALIAFNHTLEELGQAIPLLSSASLHAVCPFGGVVSIYQYATGGTFVKKTHESSFILMIIVAALAVFMGPVFCGWICPFGTVQEFFGKIGKKLFKKKFNRFIPYKFDRWLRFLRYIVLVWVIYMTAVTGKIIFADYDPYFALFNFWTGEVAISGLVILFISLLLSIFVERPFCKYACPYGAVLGISNFFRIFKIKRTESSCINCGACDKACPMNIQVSRSATVRNHQCISCMKCTSEQVCPVADTVDLRVGANPGNKTIGSKLIAPIVLAVFIVGIGLSMIFNIWVTESSKTPAVYSSGEFEGIANPADIRGSYFFSDISKAFDIDVEILAQAFGVDDPDPSGFQVKEFEEILLPLDDGAEVGTDSVRLFVARYLGLPYTPEETTRLPFPAINLLKDKLTPADIESLQEISIRLSDVKPEYTDEAGESNTLVEEYDEEETVIKGKTTFDDLLKWGLAIEEIESVLGIELGARGTSVRDYLMENELEFSVYKEKLQVLVDARQ